MKLLPKIFWQEANKLAGTREALELRANFTWNTPGQTIRLLKASGTWAEANVARETVFGTELEDAEGGVRETITLDSQNYDSDLRALELILSCTVAPTLGDMVFNRLALLRGGKAQGVYTGNFDSGANTFTITTAVPEAWSPGDKIIVHNTFESFTVDSVSGTSGEILTLQETVANSATDIVVSDGSGTLLVLYVFPDSNVTVLQNNSTIFTFNGFSFTS